MQVKSYVNFHLQPSLVHGTPEFFPFFLAALS